MHQIPLAAEFQTPADLIWCGLFAVYSRNQAIFKIAEAKVMSEKIGLSLKFFLTCYGKPLQCK